MAERKPFLLRIDPQVLEALQKWAADVEAKGETAPAPLPLARALGHSESRRRAA